mgnify:CR=1 FL=1
MLHDFYNLINICICSKSLNIPKLLQELCAKQERCLKLGQLLDDESGRILKSHPKIQNTLNDVFSVEKIEGKFCFFTFN